MIDANVVSCADTISEEQGGGEMIDFSKTTMEGEEDAQTAVEAVSTSASSKDGNGKVDDETEAERKRQEALKRSRSQRSGKETGGGKPQRSPGKLGGKKLKLTEYQQTLAEAEDARVLFLQHVGRAKTLDVAILEEPAWDWAQTPKAHGEMKIRLEAAENCSKKLNALSKKFLRGCPMEILEKGHGQEELQKALGAFPSTLAEATTRLGAHLERISNAHFNMNEGLTDGVAG